MTRYTYRAAVAVLLLATALILSVIPALDHAAQAHGATATAANRKPNPRNPIIRVHPLVISQTCDEAVNATHAPHCIQAAGRGNPVSMFAANGQPNQQFDIFLPGPGSMACGDDISDPGCPFPGTPVGDQIVVIGGQDNQNSGSCGGWTSLRTQGSLTACNGGSGIDFVVDGHAFESGLLGRQTGGKTYLCENPGNVPTVRTVFTPGDCQWFTQAQ